MCVYTFAFLACIPSLLLSNKKNTEYLAGLALLPIVFHRKVRKTNNNNIWAMLGSAIKYLLIQVFFIMIFTCKRENQRVRCEELLCGRYIRNTEYLYIYILYIYIYINIFVYMYIHII